MSGADDGTIPLGKSGLRVSPMGVGTNRWGDGRAARPELKTVFDEALAQGFSFFDTAEIYGFGGSERTLGLCLGPGLRPALATKFFPMPWRVRRQALVSALRASLRRLGVEKVDLYMVHMPIPPLPVEAWADALADAVEAGLTRAVGVSNYNAEQTRRAHAVLASRGIALACNEVEYSLVKRDAENNGVYDTCRELGVSLIAYRPLALGLLPGRHSPSNPPSGWRGLAFRLLYPPHIEPISDLLRSIGEAHGGKSMTQVALNWVMSKGAIPIPGATSVEHIRENAGAFGWRLTDEEVAALDALGRRRE